MKRLPPIVLDLVDANGLFLNVDNSVLHLAGKLMRGALEHKKTTRTVHIKFEDRTIVIRMTLVESRLTDQTEKSSGR